jgi:hypothetical protein
MRRYDTIQALFDLVGLAAILSFTGILFAIAGRLPI